MASGRNTRSLFDSELALVLRLKVERRTGGRISEFDGNRCAEMPPIGCEVVRKKAVVGRLRSTIFTEEFKVAPEHARIDLSPHAPTETPCGLDEGYFEHATDEVSLSHFTQITVEPGFFGPFDFRQGPHYIWNLSGPIAH